MADEADIANDTAQQHLDALMQHKRDTGPEPTGRCHFCGVKTPKGHRWCDADCRDLWQEKRDHEQKYGRLNVHA
jgi:predicted nucleic acid-binding Zn ribbon protein